MPGVSAHDPPYYMGVKSPRAAVLLVLSTSLMWRFLVSYCSLLPFLLQSQVTPGEGQAIALSSPVLVVFIRIFPNTIHS